MTAADVVPATELPAGAWDAFCATSNDAWFFHGQGWLAYSLAHRPDLAPVSRSFALVDGDGILAACPLVEETFADEAGPVKEFSRSHGGLLAAPVPALRAGLGERRRAQAFEAVLAQVDALALEHGVARTTLRCHALAPGALQGRWPVNPFPRHGYLEASIATQLLDLRQPEENLWAGLTKGHRYDVRRGGDGLRFEVVAGGDDGKTTFAAYRALHAKAAGRVTRPVGTFDMQAKWLRDGQGLLVGASTPKGWTAFAYLLVHKAGAYYMSGCEDPDGDPDLPVGHALQWRIVQELRARSVATYEIGWQYFSPQMHYLASEKEISISAFKRRFGGKTVPLWSGERFHQMQYLESTMCRRARLLAARPPVGRPP